MKTFYKFAALIFTVCLGIILLAIYVPTNGYVSMASQATPTATSTPQPTATAAPTVTPQPKKLNLADYRIDFNYNHFTVQNYEDATSNQKMAILNQLAIMGWPNEATEKTLTLLSLSIHSCVIDMGRDTDSLIEMANDCINWITNLESSRTKYFRAAQMMIISASN